MTFPQDDGSSWRRDAACVGVDVAVFFSDRRAEHRALAICAECPVRAECLTEALAEERGRYVYGVRGGLTERDRRSRLSFDRWLAKW